MSRRGTLILAGGLTAACLAFIVLISRINSRSTPVPPRPPELGGQRVPATIFEIRFDRRYDLHASMDRGEPALFRDCKILGFTGEGEDAGSSRAGSGGFSSGSYSSRERYFEHWLVLELADGRLAYIPPSAVKYIEEAAPEGG